jgi:hypothetical protein
MATITTVKWFLVQAPGCTVVEHLTHNPKVEGLSPTAGTGLMKKFDQNLFYFNETQ